MKQEPTGIAGKRIVLTGGTTGIGRAMACLLASRQAEVFVCGRHRAELEDALEEGQRKGTPFSGTVADVSRPEEVERFFREAVDVLGGVDILIANAGLPAEGIKEEEEWRYVIETNVCGYIDCAVHALRHFRNRTDPRHIVLIGSMSADVLEAGSSVYVATKCAIQGLATSLRKEINPEGIHVHLIEPGLTRSDMVEADEAEQETKLRKQEMLFAEDVADAVLYVLTRPVRCSVVDLKVRPLKQLI